LFIIKKYSFDLVIRDFTPATNSDFELAPLGLIEGLVSTNLGADRKPVYENPANSACITSAATFNQWYNDVQGVNLKITKTMPLTLNASNYLVYENTAFFPIDAEGFGNYYLNSYAHNYHFTVEIHSGFVFNGDEVFRFIGDDDIWIFINNKRVIDIGGIHNALEQSVTLDSDKAAELGLVQGQVYNLDIFTAERHTTNSTFRFFTNAVIVSPGVQE
jgi:fibro-slime domain-containing protein